MPTAPDQSRCLLPKENCLGSPYPPVTAVLHDKITPVPTLWPDISSPEFLWILAGLCPHWSSLLSALTAALCPSGPLGFSLERPHVPSYPKGLAMQTEFGQQGLLASWRWRRAIPVHQTNCPSEAPQPLGIGQHSLSQRISNQLGWGRDLPPENLLETPPSLRPSPFSCSVGDLPRAGSSETPGGASPETDSFCASRQSSCCQLF